MPELDLRKVKFNGVKLQVVYHTPSDLKVDLEGWESLGDEFLEAIQAFVVEAKKICDLPAEYNAEVRGIIISTAGDEPQAMVTMLHKVSSEQIKSPLVLNSPLAPAVIFDAEIRELRRRVGEWMAGKRGQLGLFEPLEETPAGNETA